MSPITERLQKANADITAQRECRECIRLIPKVLLQITFPQHDPGDIPEWRRTQNGVSIAIQPYRNEAGRACYPFGSFARLLFYWLAWEAIDKGARTIYLRDSFNRFMHTFGYRTENARFAGKAKEMLREHLFRLLRAKIDFTEAGRKWDSLLIGSRGLVEFDPLTARLRLTQDSFVTLGEDFYASVTEWHMPVDIRALRALKHSPLALDLYGWGTDQVFQMRKRHAGGSPRAELPARITPWRTLMHQFGADYRRPRKFKEHMQRALRAVQVVYPEFLAEAERDGLRVFMTRPAVLDGERRVSVTD
jgi:Plasmid encoded RepA protein